MVVRPLTRTRSSQCQRNCSGQDGALDLGALAGELGDIGLVRNPHDVLLDDRALIEILGGVMRGRADELHSTCFRLFVGTRADKGRQERMMDVDHRYAHSVKEVTGQDLHIAR